MHCQLLLLSVAYALLQFQLLLLLPDSAAARPDLTINLSQRLLQQEPASPVALRHSSGAFGAAPADSADCDVVCHRAFGMSEINGGVQGQQACAVYSEAAWRSDRLISACESKAQITSSVTQSLMNERMW